MYSSRNQKKADNQLIFLLLLSLAVLGFFVLTGAAFIGSSGRGINTFPFTAFTPPVFANFTWINQGSATADTTTIPNTIFLSTPGASGDSVKILKKSIPAATYSITAYVMPFVGGVNFSASGLIWRESSSGKLSTCGILHSTNLKGATSHFNTATSFNADVTTVDTFQSSVLPQQLYLRITDNGTNRVCEYSADGAEWRTIASESRTTFLTADEVGIFTNSNNASSRSSGLRLISWLETIP